MAVRGAEVLVPRIQVGVDRYERDVVGLEVPDDRDVDGMLAADGDRELPVPYRRAHREVHLGEHVLRQDEVVAVAVVVHVELRLMDAVLEVYLLKIVGGPPYGGGGLPGSRLEAGGVVVRDAEDHDVGIVVV